MPSTESAAGRAVDEQVLAANVDTIFGRPKARVIRGNVEIPYDLDMFFARFTTVAGIELYEEACHEGNASLEHIRTAGYGMYFGLSAREARELKKAWEAKR